MTHHAWIAGAAMLLMASLSVLAAGAGPRPGGGAAGHFLLLDSRVVDKAENARLAVGTVTKHPANPLFREDKPWEPRFDNLYANVLYDEDAKLYKCWYSPFIVDKTASSTPHGKRGKVPYRPHGREMGVCYAVSKDGLKWDKPELGLVEFAGSKANNLVVRGPHGAGVFPDPREADPARRFKMFYQGMAVRFSPDGLRWSAAVKCPQIAARGDTHNNAFWDPARKKYVGITRLWAGQRIVGRTESEDFVRWTKAVEVLRGDKANQTYAMPVFRYGNVYLGLAMIFRPRPNRVHCELTWSPDTIQWHRVDKGMPLIPLSEKKGAYDWGCAYAAAYPVVLGGEIRLYYGASNGTHNGWRDGFLALATLRPDGWAAYVPQDKAKPAVVVTKPVTCGGRALLVTADAKGGAVVASLLDDSGKAVAQTEAVTDDVTNAVVSWKGRNPLAGRSGKPVRLRFEIRAAKLYSFRFAAVPK